MIPKDLSKYKLEFEKLLWHRYLIAPNDCIEDKQLEQAFTERQPIDELVEEMTEGLDREDGHYGVHYGKSVKETWSERSKKVNHERISSC